jgi:hypothetical protein
MSLNEVAETARTPKTIGTGTCRFCDRPDVNCIWVDSNVRGLVSHTKLNEPFVECDAGEGSPPRAFVNRQLG